MATISGGDKLAARLTEIGKKATKAVKVDVGFLSGATYPDGTSVPLVAAVQEFGAPSRGIPPRPFFRTMVAAKSTGWGDTVAKLLEANDYDAEKTLAMMGDGISEQLRDSIIKFAGAPLSPKTVARKGFATPLIDTSVMLNSIDYSVE